MISDIENFLAFASIEKGLSTNTISAYETDLRQFRDYLAGKDIDSWESVTRDIILDFLDIAYTKQLSSATIARKLVTVKIFFRYMFGEGVIANNVTEIMDSPRLWRLLPDFLSEAEIKRLISSYARSKTLLGRRNHMLLELMYACGLRVSEVAGLRVDEVKFDPELLRVTGKGGKTRIVPFSWPTRKLLGVYLSAVRPALSKLGNEPHLFLSNNGKPLTRARIWTLVKEAGRIANIKKNIYPHTIRHSFASHLLSNGADLRIIQELLGHADIATTQVYTHVNQAHLAKVHGQFHPRK